MGRHTWTALAAPMNHAAPDGRKLAGHQWTLRELAPLVTLPDRQIVGGVTGLEVTDTALCCTGYVYGDWDELAGKMATGELRPQLEVDGGEFKVEFDGDEPVMIFRGGKILAVALGDLPAFPEARFTHVAPAEGQ